MDLAKRIMKIVTNNSGLAMFVKIAKPNTGFISVLRETSYRINEFTADELVGYCRMFLISHLLDQDGIVAYRRGGRVTFGTFVYHLTQAEAEEFARSQNIAWLVNIETNARVQIGNFEPDISGDGDV